MGRIKDGFNKGSIIICIDTIGATFLTLHKEYEVLAYLPKAYYNKDGPNVMIWVDRYPLKKLLSCNIFMPKSKWESMIRDNKINSILE